MNRRLAKGSRIALLPVLTGRRSGREMRGGASRSDRSKVTHSPPLIRLPAPSPRKDGEKFASPSLSPIGTAARRCDEPATGPAIAPLPHRHPHAHLAHRRDRRARHRRNPVRRALLRRPRADPGSVFPAHHAVPGAILEPARRLCRAGVGRPAGLRRARRLSAVRASSSCGASIRSFRSCCRASSRRWSRCPPPLSCSACAAPISRSAPGWWRKCSGCCWRSSSRSAAAPAPRCRAPPPTISSRSRRSPSCSACARPRRATSSPTGWR